MSASRHFVAHRYAAAFVTLFPYICKIFPLDWRKTWPCFAFACEHQPSQIPTRQAGKLKPVGFGVCTREHAIFDYLRRRSSFRVDRLREMWPQVVVVWRWPPISPGLWKERISKTPHGIAEEIMIYRHQAIAWWYLSCFSRLPFAPSAKQAVEVDDVCCSITKDCIPDLLSLY